MVVLLALGVGVAVLVEEAAPLDGRTNRGEAQGLEKHQVIVATIREVIPRVRANAVVEVLDPQVGPGIPQVLELAAITPMPLGLRTGHRSTKEEVVWQLVGLLCPRLPPPFLPGFSGC